MVAASISARNGEKEICSICQDSSGIEVRLECGHIFHILCIATWYRREKTCPLDRGLFEIGMAKQVEPAHPISISSLERVSQLRRLIMTVCFDGCEERLRLIHQSQALVPLPDRTIAESGLRSGSTIWATTFRDSPTQPYIPPLRFELTIREP